MSRIGPQPAPLIFNASRLDVAHTLRMVKLAQEAIVLAKGTNGARVLTPQIQNALDQLAATTATVCDAIGQLLDA